MELRVSATKDGFSAASTTVFALAGRTITVPTLNLAQTAAEEIVSGNASNILLLEQSAQSIGVRIENSRHRKVSHPSARAHGDAARHPPV